MSLSKTCHQVRTWRVYPRVNFFWKRYKGLLPRFKRLIEAFPPSFHDDDLCREIDDVKMKFEHALGVVILGYDSLDIGDIVIWKQWQEELVEDTDLEAVITVHLCYSKIDQMDDRGWQKVSSTIDFFYNEYGRSDLSLFDSLFVVVDILLTTPSTNEEQLFKHKILKKVQTLCPEWRDKDSILFESRSGHMCNKLSEWLETKLVLGFHKVFSHLEVFIRHERQSSLSDVNLLQNILDNQFISKFLQNELIIKEIRDLVSSDESAESAGKTMNEKLVHHWILKLPLLVKCILVPSAAEKYDLVPWQVNLFLHELSFENGILASISEYTRDLLKQFTMYSNKESAKSIGQSFVNDIEKCVTDIEMKLKNMATLVTVMEKMMFEIEGYLSATITEVYIPKSVAPNVPDALRKDLLRLNEVFAVGTVYNKFEVHVQANTPEIRKKIDALIQKHMFSWQYIVKPVDQDIQSMGHVMHENGAMIKCPPSKQGVTEEQNVIVKRNVSAEYHTGTVGCFATDDDNKLYGLTAAHVVSNPQQNSCEVFVCDQSSQLSKFGETKRNLVVRSGQSSYSLIDIAAIQIYDHIIPRCLALPKDDCGCNRNGYIAKENLSDLLKKFVFKHGAVSGLTTGIICSTDFTVLGPNNYLVMIESLPVDKEPFAERGDSGSVICCSDINTDQVKLISMLTGGDYKVKGDLTPKYLSFLLRIGLKQLSAKSGILLSVPRV